MSMKLLAILVLALVPLALSASIPSNDYVSAMKSLDDNMLSYDKRIRPGVGGNAVNVTASMYIIRAYDYNEKTHSLKMNVYFRQKWIDSRLSFSSSSATQIKGGQDLLEKIWKPDTFFVSATNEVLHSVPNPNIFVRIDSNGEVFISHRMTLEVFCEPKKNSFPKTCNFDVESYGMTAEDITYAWKHNDNSSKKAVGHDQDAFLGQSFNLTSLEEYQENIALPSGVYSKIGLKINIDRV